MLASAFDYLLCFNLMCCAKKVRKLINHPVVYLVVVYYESIKRELKIKSIYECRCDERLQTKTREVTRLEYTGLAVELEHLKIETRLTIC